MSEHCKPPYGNTLTFQRHGNKTNRLILYSSTLNIAYSSLCMPKICSIAQVQCSSERLAFLSLNNGMVPSGPQYPRPITSNWVRISMINYLYAHFSALEDANGRQSKARTTRTNGPILYILRLKSGLLPCLPFVGFVFKTKIMYQFFSLRICMVNFLATLHSHLGGEERTQSHISTVFLLNMQVSVNNVMIPTGPHNSYQLLLVVVELPMDKNQK